MERIGLWRLSANAWRDAAEAMRRHASLFTLAFIGLLIVYWLSLSLSPAPQSFAEIRANPTLVSRTLPAVIVVSVIDALLRICIITPCAVTAHRLVLIAHEADHTPLRRPRVVRFALCLIALPVATFAALLLGGVAIVLVGLVVRVAHLPVAVTKGALLVLMLALLVAIVVIPVRFALVFPAVAVDHAAPWAASWRLTRSRWWRTASAFFLCLFVPSLVFGLLLALATVLPRDGAVAVRAFVGAAGLLMVTVGAALASWLYREYGGDTVSPVVVW